MSTYRRGAAHPDLAPSILSMVERERLEAYKDRCWLEAYEHSPGNIRRLFFTRWLIRSGRLVAGS